MKNQKPLNLIGLPPAARYAFQGLAYLARQNGPRFRLVEEASAEGRLPKDFLAKIFQRLSRDGFLISQRGPGGGYALARPAVAISLLDILEAVEHPPHDTPCMFLDRPCWSERPCALHEKAAEARAILKEALGGMNLAQLAEALS